MQGFVGNNSVLAHDRHAIAEVFHFAERVTRKEYRGPGNCPLPQATGQLSLHQRVKTGPRFFQNQQPWPGQHETKFLARAFGHFAYADIHFQLKSLRERGAFGTQVEPADLPDNRQGGFPRHPGIETEVAGQVADVPFNLSTLSPTVEPEDRGVSAAGIQEAEQDPNRGRLASAIRPQKAERFTFTYFQVDGVNADTTAIVPG